MALRECTSVRINSRTWADVWRGSNDLMRRFMPSLPSVPRDAPF